MPRKTVRIESAPSSSRMNDDSVDQFELNEIEECVDMIFVPNPNDCGDSGDESDVENSDSDEVEFYESFRQMAEEYTVYQTKLEEEHEFIWANGEKIYNEILSNEILLTDNEKKKILSCSPVELFEYFFSRELKKQIIDATKEHGFDLCCEDFNAFLGILIFTTFNKRSSQRDYWSLDPFLRSDLVANVMSRNKFEMMKAKIKYHKLEDVNENDKVWRVRSILNIFRKNIQKFGVFSTVISIDEMMCKYFGRAKLKQFIKGKPIRYGIKMWALCGADGYLFDCDIYCGKNINSTGVLSKCAMGSRVVLQMLEQLINKTSVRKINKYHVYFDNLFSSSDLLIHLKKGGLRATGTVRENRVKEHNDIPKNASRGAFVVQHEKNSGLNFITLKDSKTVSILSTAAGVTPQTSVKRYNKESKKKVDILFPNAIAVYNQFMGGVDVHDMYCNRVMPIVRSKKWTWVIFVRIIQSSITNATVLWNTVCGDGRKLAIKDIALSIAKSYMTTKSDRSKMHQIIATANFRYCSNVKKCGKRTYNICNSFDLYFCSTCFAQAHVR